MYQLGFRRFLGQCRDLPRAVRTLGFGATAVLVRSNLMEYCSLLTPNSVTLRNRIHSLRPKACAAPIHYRLYTSDINVLEKIFLSGEYDCVGSEVEPKFIVDCGANIGCASVYFLNRYPNASVIAIEPDSGNFEVCQWNIALTARGFGHCIVQSGRGAKD